MKSTDVSRFLEGFTKTDSCWNWDRSTDTGGYGMFYYEGRDINAHRFSYLYFKGDIPDGLLVRHTCDNPRCVNPDHLLLGTHADNVADMDRRGRRVVVKKFGLDNPNGRLSDQDVNYIRKYKRYYGYRKDLAKFFNISVGTVESIVSNKRHRVGMENGDDSNLSVA